MDNRKRLFRPEKAGMHMFLDAQDFLRPHGFSLDVAGQPLVSDQL